MINAKIFFRGEKITGFKITGHANQAPKGYDIVCAAVSSISQTALLGVGKYLEREIFFDQGSPEIGGLLELKLKDEPDDLTDAILQTMLIGLEEVEKLYPEFVNISREEEL